MKVLEDIESVCPECLNEGKLFKISAQIIEEDNKIYIKKSCEEHGEFKDVLFNDSKLYHRWKKYEVTGDEIKGINTSELYDKHYSQSLLTNLLVTNRCNLRCNYCFMNAGASGKIYEPSLEQLKEMINAARNQKPIPSKAIQITGGEPTIREDLFEIINLAKESGFVHIQLNTNGIKLAEDFDYCKKLQEVGVHTVYLSFDGVTKDTNPWIEENKKAIENLRKAKLGTVLVPTVIKNRNLKQAGDIVQFALENIDIIRGVNFQPISFCGRASKNEINEGRVDYSLLFEELEKKFDGAISRDDFYPVPFMYPISKLIELLKSEKQIEFTASSGCGGATYVFKEEDKIIPITRFMDVEGFLEFINELSTKKGLLKKYRIATSFLKNYSRYIDKSKAPKDLSIRKIIIDSILNGEYKSLGNFHWNSLFIGTMWFQDAYNLNMNRLKKCVIHYSTPEGIVPFCAYNSLNVGEKIRDKYSISISEWEQKGNNLKNDLWKNGPLT